MRFGVLGTGTVGQTLASKLVTLEHTVMMGARVRDNHKAVDWANREGQRDRAMQGSFADAAQFAEVIINATAGSASIEALTMARADNMINKVLIDVSNPLTTAANMQITLSVCNKDSLGEQI